MCSHRKQDGNSGEREADGLLQDLDADRESHCAWSASHFLERGQPRLCWWGDDLPRQPVALQSDETSAHQMVQRLLSYEVTLAPGG